MSLNLRWVVVGLSVASLLGVPEARAALDSCAVDWSNFSGADGFISEYTYLGEGINDHEQAADPSNGGTAVNPDWIDISSASPSTPRGPSPRWPSATGTGARSGTRTTR